MYTIALLAVQNCMYSSITGPHECFPVASSVWQGAVFGNTEPLFQPTLVGPEECVTAFNGTRILVEKTLSDDFVYDIVFVPVIVGDLAPLLADNKTFGWLAVQ